MVVGVWRLIRTRDRVDGSVAVLHAIRRRPSIITRLRSRRNAVRSERLTRAAPTADRIVAALGPVAERHHMGRPRGRGDSVTWCTSAELLRTIGSVDDDDADVDADAPWHCTDLTVTVDQLHSTIAVDLDGHGLAEFMTDRTRADGPVSIRLDDDLDIALGHLVQHLDRLCESVIVTDR